MPDNLMMAVSAPEAVRQAELIVLGQMRDQLSAMTSEMVAHRKDMSEVKVDVATIKGTLAMNSELKEKLGELEDEVSDLKLRNAKQDGAAALFQFLKDYGGWLAGLAGLAYGLFLHH